MQYEKKQSLCVDHERRPGGCTRGATQCRFDHDLVDSERIEKLVRSPLHSSLAWHCDSDYLTVECRVISGVARWKIILKPDAGLKNYKHPVAHGAPPLPTSHEGTSLLEVIQYMEGALGVTTNLNV